MKIGIIGTGNMGRSLGLVWAELGHSVFFGAQEIANAQQAVDLARKNNAKGEVFAGSNDEAAQFGEVLFYTARGVAPNVVLEDASLLDGKIIIDPNNSDIPDGFVYEPITFSLAEKLQAQVPKARVVKAFNTLSQETYELSPEPLREQKVSVFVAADDAIARSVVMQLAREMGFVPLDCGPLRTARLIEGLSDFIRFVMIGQGQGAYTAISVHALPEPTCPLRLGGRQASRLDS